MYNTDLPNRAALPSSKQLLRSTIIAIFVAAVLLATVVLPSEYGIDPTGLGRIMGLTQMGEIKMHLAQEAKKADEAEAAEPAAETKAVLTPKNETNAGKEKIKEDERTVTLKPGEGIEIKLVMAKDAKVTYKWTTTGGAVNYDTHGEGQNKAFASYKKGRNVEGDEGELVAKFDGTHGWFWRNRTNSDVSIKLETSGEYQSIK